MGFNQRRRRMRKIKRHKATPTRGLKLDGLAWYVIYDVFDGGYGGIWIGGRPYSTLGYGKLNCSECVMLIPGTVDIEA